MAQYTVIKSDQTTTKVDADMCTIQADGAVTFSTGNVMSDCTFLKGTWREVDGDPMEDLRTN
jgi:hypothetical protein